jgi:hypothetical protein
MQPKIAYLVDENAGWDEDPSWKFYTENEIPEYILLSRWQSAGKIKRIVYWETEEVA